jgi:acetyl esterase/lipase
MMLHETISLYSHFHIPEPSGADGRLTAWIPDRLTALGASRCHPAVLILPGGGYEHVSTREAEPVALRFLAKGYAAFVLQYSCGPHPFPVALREAAMAMKYIRTNADRFGLRPDRVAAVGFSAGGHLCGCLGTLFDASEVSDIGDSMLLRPDILGLCYPVALSWGRTHEGSFQNLTFGNNALRSRLSLEKMVRADMPPAFLWHTREDTSVPCRNSLLLAASMEEQAVPFALHIYHKGPHGLSVADETAYSVGAVPAISDDVPGWVDGMLGFFGEFDFRIVNGEGSV